MIRRAFSRLPPLVRAVLPGLLLSAAALVAFVALLDAVNEGDDLSTLDQPVMDWLADHREPWLTAVLTVVTNAFGPVVLPILVGGGCALWGWRTGRWRPPLMLAGSMVFSTMVAVAVKALVQRPRPDESLQVIPGLETSFSFPSGHTSGAATFILVGAYLAWRHERGTRQLIAWLWVSAAVIGLVGVSRMYLGYHFFTDVLAGAFLGLFTLGLVVTLSRLLDLWERGRSSPDGG
jgi:undecaprenyl-diphosphatase